MPLGQPAIPGVRTLALRDVQGAIDRIRERFAAVESQVATTTAQAGQTTFTLGQSNASISNLQRQVSALVTRLDALPTPTDRLETFIAAAAIEQYDPVYVTTAGYVSPASATEINAAYGVIGVATTGAALGGNVVVRKSGTMQIAGAVFEPGGPVYLGLDGLTQFPDYVGVAIPVGVAVGTDQLDVTPGWPALQYPGVYSEFETFLPATWGLVRNAVELTDDFNSAANGIIAKTGFGDVSTRTLQQPAAGVTITNPAGIAGDPTFALANDLAALEGLASTGFAVRTGADTWAQRAVAGTADRVSVTNGNGVSDDPTVDIAATYVGQTSITTLGTVATGVWQGTAVGATFGGTAQTTWVAGDLLYASGANTLAKRAIGATGDVLTVSGGVPVWAAPAASGGTVTSVGITGSDFTITGSPVTTSGDIDLTLATVNSNVGSFGSSTAIPNFTVNAKGLITAAGTSAVVAPAGTLTGTTLASNVVTSSLTSVGTIGTGVWQGTAVAAGFGGTGFATYADGDLLVGLSGAVLAKLPIGSANQVLTVSGGVPVWAAAPGGGLTATQVGFGSGANVLTGSANLTWTDGTRTLVLGVGTGPSRIFTAPAASGAGASSLTIQTGAASAGVVGAGLLSVLGGAGAGASAAGNVDVAGGDHPSNGQAGNLSLRGGVSASGTNGTVTVEVAGVARITVANTGAVTISSALTLSSTLNATSGVFSSTLQATSGTFSSTLQSTSLLVTGSTAPANGMYLQAAGVVGLSANSTAAYKYGSNAFLAQNDNTRDLGETGTGNWRNIFSQNAVTVASDQRNKTEVETSVLGLDFVRALRPVSYRQIVGSNNVIVLEDGTHVEIPVPGRRRHYGFLAQQVHQVLTAIGMDGTSFAGWCISNIDDPDSHQSLRYEQFIAPLVKAVQELANELEVLKAQPA